MVQIARCKLFRINTYKTDTKQTTLSIFRMNTYAKLLGGRVPSSSSRRRRCTTPVHMESSARNPMPSCVYLTVLWIPSGWGDDHSPCSVAC